MRIAQVAPLYESVPPKLYGGTERVVSYLTEELVSQGHEVTLFASGDSVTAARLISLWPKSLRLDDGCMEKLAPHYLMFERVFEAAGEFDLIHFHTDYLHLPMWRRQPVRAVTTLHGCLNFPEIVSLYGEFRTLPVISISESQRATVPFLNWQATVHHGLPAGQYRVHPKEGRYLAFLGRISPEKRVDRAIEIAKRVKMPIRIAAKVDAADKRYFQEKIAPLLDHPLVEFIGEIGEDQKNEFLGNAYALLFPIDWHEPFGLVMIEAMACGTPVIGFRGGSVPEVIDDGVTGWIVDDLDEAVQAVGLIPRLSRLRCREVFESRFTNKRMAQAYLAVYERLIEHQRESRLAAD